MEDTDFEVFKDEDQKKVILDLKRELEALKAGKDAEDDLGFENDPKIKKDRANVAKFDKIWRSNGRLDGFDGRIKLEELLERDKRVTKQMSDNFSTDLPMNIPRVLAQMVREAIEPALVLTPLLTRINYSHGPRLTFPAFGALAGAAADIGEGEEYPAGNMEMAGQTECIIGKSGIAVQTTEEQVKYSQYDIISMNIRAAGRALARHKETKVANLITTNGTTLIDNSSASYPSTTGRNAAGDYNGTLTLDDMFRAWSTMVNTGFVPNTLIMNPFAWRIFAEEGMARLFGFTHGQQGMLWQMPQGRPGNAEQWRATPLNQNTYVSSPENIASTFTRVPSLFPTNFNIIVSPFIPLNSNNTTTIVFCDVNELGILVVDEDVSSDEWVDPSKDIKRMKFRERYGLAIKNDGRAVGLLKNIKIGKSVDFVDRISVQYTTGSFTSNPLSGDPEFNGIISL